MEKNYVLYDGRYLTDPDSAYAYTVAEDLEEAMEDLEYFPDAVIVEYDVNGSELLNPRIVDLKN